MLVTSRHSALSRRAAVIRSSLKILFDFAFFGFCWSQGGPWNHVKPKFPCMLIEIRLCTRWTSVSHGCCHCVAMNLSNPLHLLHASWWCRFWAATARRWRHASGCFLSLWGRIVQSKPLQSNQPPPHTPTNQLQTKRRHMTTFPEKLVILSPSQASCLSKQSGTWMSTWMFWASWAAGCDWHWSQRNWQHSP